MDNTSPQPSDSALVDLGPESVAYYLMRHVLAVEGRPLDVAGSRLSRNLILDAYADCLSAVRGERPLRAPRKPAGGSAGGEA